MFTKDPKTKITMWQPKEKQSQKFKPYDGGKQPEVDSTPEQVVEKHGPASSVKIQHDHENNKHTVSSTHEDGHKHESVHSSAAEAYETGGALANTDVKKREHFDQQGAQSEEDGFEMPDLA